MPRQRTGISRPLLRAGLKNEYSRAQCLRDHPQQKGVPMQRAHLILAVILSVLSCVSADMPVQPSPPMTLATDESEVRTLMAEDSCLYLWDAFAMSGSVNVLRLDATEPESGRGLPHYTQLLRATWFRATTEPEDASGTMRPLATTTIEMSSWPMNVGLTILPGSDGASVDSVVELRMNSSQLGVLNSWPTLPDTWESEPLPSILRPLFGASSSHSSVTWRIYTGGYWNSADGPEGTTADLPTGNIVADLPQIWDMTGISGFAFGETVWLTGTVGRECHLNSGEIWLMPLHEANPSGEGSSDLPVAPVQFTNTFFSPEIGLGRSPAGVGLSGRAVLLALRNSGTGDTAHFGPRSVFGYESADMATWSPIETIAIDDDDILRLAACRLDEGTDRVVVFLQKPCGVFKLIVLNSDLTEQLDSYEFISPHLAVAMADDPGRIDRSGRTVKMDVVTRDGVVYAFWDEDLASIEAQRDGTHRRELRYLTWQPDVPMVETSTDDGLTIETLAVGGSDLYLWDIIPRPGSVDIVRLDRPDPEVVPDNLRQSLGVFSLVSLYRTSGGMREATVEAVSVEWSGEIEVVRTPFMLGPHHEPRMALGWDPSTDQIDLAVLSVQHRSEMYYLGEWAGLADVDVPMIKKPLPIPVWVAVQEDGLPDWRFEEDGYLNYSSVGCSGDQEFMWADLTDIASVLLRDEPWLVGTSRGGDASIWLSPLTELRPCAEDRETIAASREATVSSPAIGRGASPAAVDMSDRVLILALLHLQGRSGHDASRLMSVVGYESADMEIWSSIETIAIDDDDILRLAACRLDEGSDRVVVFLQKPGGVFKLIVLNSDLTEQLDSYEFTSPELAAAIADDEGERDQARRVRKLALAAMDGVVYAFWDEDLASIEAQRAGEHRRELRYVAWVPRAPLASPRAHRIGNDRVIRRTPEPTPAEAGNRHEGIWASVAIAAAMVPVVVGLGLWGWRHRR